MGPIDYSAAFGGVNPMQSFAQSFQLGAGIQDRRLAQEQQQLAIQQAQAKAMQEQAMREELAALSADPSPQKIAALSIKYPQLSEGFKRSYDMLAPEQRQAKLSATVPVYSAAINGRPEIAADLLATQADALQNSGREQEAAQTRAFSELFRTQPEAAKQTAGLLLATAMGPEKFVETFGKLGAERRADEMQPVAMRKAEAEAGTAESESVIRAADAQVAPQMSVAKLNEQLAKASKEAVAAKFAESRAVQDLKLGEAQIRALATDEQIKRQNVAIASMNAQTARAGNDLQRQRLQLDLQQLVEKRDTAVREKVAGAEAAASTIDNMLNTIERIRQNPRLNAVLGGIEGRTPAVRDESVNAIALIDTLGSQAFLSQIPQIKGMGQLSNAEGEKLQAAFQNFSRVQSEKQFRANLDEAMRLLDKARAGVEKSSGIKLRSADVPATAAPNAAQLDELLKKYGGK